MVETGRETNLPRGEPATDLRRRWRQQWEPIARLEAQPPTLGGPDPDTNYRLSLSLPTRHQQVEQDRASAIFVHQSELERRALDQLRDGCQPHRWDQDAHRTESKSSARYE